MKSNFRNFCLVMAAAAVVAACGNGSDAPGTPAQQAASASDEQPRGACSLLTREQVNTVIPGNDGGKEQDASEASLLKDVKMEHCRYFHVEGTNLKFLDLLIYKASSDEGFKQIKIGKWAHQGSSRELDIGDIGFLLDMSEQNEMVATASKGRTVFELKLVADDAPAKSESLIDLARIVGGKI
jgi:hypothetical protein